VGAAVVFGALVGYGAGRLLERAQGEDTIEQTSFLAYTLALSLAVLGSAKLLGTDGVLAVFVAGLAFNTAVSESDRAEEERVQEAVNRFFILPVFVLLGLAIPWKGWMELGWAGALLALSVLLLRRLPAVLALKPLLGRVGGMQGRTFPGWFGPIGVAALFYANFSVSEAGTEEAWVIGSLIICASVLVHGLSATPLTRLYGRHAQNDASSE
jgi:NhaP-type Na+/H+ or K+/H+ antiporter